MATRIERVGVIGAGVMGSGIAAHLANCGIKVLMLDIVPPKLSEADKGDKAKRDSIAAGGLAKAVTAKPAAFYHKSLARLVETGNLEDDFEKLASCQWIVEVVPERLDIKRPLLARLEKLTAGKDILVTSNTSGLKILDMTHGLGAEFRKRFFVTHFFNPVRYMKLLELVASPDTDRALYDHFAAWAEKTLGKGIVHGKDTPNFVANRIGVYALMKSVQVMEELDLAFDAVDKIAGPAMGRPKSAAFKTADLVGLDTFAHVTDNCYETLVNDEERDVFKRPAWLGAMLEKGLLGNKTKAGFYKKEGKESLVFDRKTLAYGAKTDFKAESLSKAKNEDDLAKRLRVVLNADDTAGKFAWAVTSASLIYSANRLGEIADDVFNIDNGMKWGFNWDMGPFETWDALGFRETCTRMVKEGKKLPAPVQHMIETGVESFYKRENGVLYFFDAVGTKKYVKAPISDAIVELKALKSRTENKVVQKNGSATFWDIGDGVGLIEFHTKMNSIDADIGIMINDALNYVEEHDWQGLVIGNEGSEAFCAGANLMLLYMHAQQQNWAEIETMVREFQNVLQRVKYSPKPVVAAPHGLTLGGGCEITMAANKVRAAAETYIGLVEVGVGLIPGGGGHKELLARCLEHRIEGVELDIFPFIRKAFEQIATAKVATSAVEAKAYNFLRESDGISVNKAQLIGDAKRTVLAMNLEGFAPPPENVFYLPGRSVAANFGVALWSFGQTNYASEHDIKIGKKVAHVLTGGDTHISKPLTEQHLLDLEREAFLSLCGEEKSQARMASILMSGKPLRN